MKEGALGGYAASNPLIITKANEEQAMGCTEQMMMEHEVSKI